jgi:drug/metabolite transporter (DMT)-like permease
MLGNVALAFGPWFVRMADVGPISSAFWRLTLAAPLLVIAMAAMKQTPRKLPATLWLILLFAGLFFAGDLASWHLGILQTKLANATLFGNSTSLLFPDLRFPAGQGLAQSLADGGAGAGDSGGGHHARPVL